MAKKKTPWTRKDLDNEEEGQLQDYLDEEDEDPGSSSEHAWLAGFEYAAKRLARKISETLKDGANEIAELGTRG